MAAGQAESVRGRLMVARDDLDRQSAELMVLQKQIGAEVERLAPLAQEASRRVREIDAHLDLYPRSEVRDAHTAALEAQLRLASMQSHLEQITFKSQLLEQQAELLSLATAAADAATLSVAEPIGTTSSLAGNVDGFALLEDDRRRIARYLHDGPAQMLANLTLQVETCERLLGRDANRARHELRSMRALVASDIGRVRRLIFELRPMILDDLGLVATLRRYAQILAEQNNTALTVSGQLDARPPADVELTLFRAAQEALGNAVRHAGAHSITAVVDERGSSIEVRITDDGAGFEPNALQVDGGLARVRRRIEALGGRLEITSELGRGTVVVATVPARAAE